MLALTTKNHPLSVAYAGRKYAVCIKSYDCALRLNYAVLDGSVEHA